MVGPYHSGTLSEGFTLATKKGLKPLNSLTSNHFYYVGTNVTDKNALQIQQKYENKKRKL